MELHTEVLVIGGGAVRVSTAYRLAKAGRQVTLVERSAIASGSSQANAGLIVPSLIVPLANPSALKKGLRWLLNPDSPFHIRPHLDPELLRWFLRFRRACQPDQVVKGMGILSSLTTRSMQILADWIDQEQIACHYEQSGWLFVYRTDQGFAEGVKEARLLEDYGIASEVLDAEQAREMEGSLRAGIRGGIYFSGDAHLDPEMFVRGLAECVKAYGGVIHTNNEVLKFEVDGDRIQAVHTSDFVAYPEAVVLAAGAWSPKLLRLLGMRTSLQPAKGYSITFSNQRGNPGLPLYLSEDKIAITPLGERLRISGILDFTGMDLRIDKRRLQTILEAARQALDLRLNGDDVQEWCGLRPCTPDGLPIIGRSELYSNLIVATGHGMLGITLAPVTAELVFKIIEGDEVDVPLEAISLERFG